MRYLRIALMILQAIAAVRVFSRMASTAQGRRVKRRERTHDANDRVTVLVPVLNEAHRLSPCLDGLTSQGPAVAEILVIDGGSTDGTIDLVQRWAGQDPRVTLIDATPIPEGVNGKAHGLQVGYEQASPGSTWIVTIDADVRPERDLVTSMLAHAHTENVHAFSVATEQELSSEAEGLVHPSMLATLVYRFGIPGNTTSNPHQVQANGQCFMVRRNILDDIGGFSQVLNDISEDVTLARLIAMQGNRVGFYESDGLVHVEMYESLRDAWDNWSRSLPMWLTPLYVITSGRNHPATVLNLGLVIARFGVLAGMSRAYRVVPWTYWLSPVFDVFVLARIWMMWGRRTHSWRGRTLVSGDPE
jgi:dolichol-phosphate mannosyltransferase